MEAEEHQILEGCDGDGVLAGDADNGQVNISLDMDMNSETRHPEKEDPAMTDSVEALDSALLDLNMNAELDDHSDLEHESKMDSENRNERKVETDGRMVTSDGDDSGNREVVCDVGDNVGYKTLESEEKDRLSFISSDHGKRANNSESMVADTSPPRSPREEKDYKDDGVRCCDYALCRCLRRVPYATLFAFLLLAGGLALMTYEIIVIRETADDLFKGTVLNADNSAYRRGLNMLLWLLIALVAVIAIFGFFFLVLACFSSGPSKKNTCGQKFVKCVNRISISVVTIIAYLLCIAWIALSMALMLGLTFMLMVRSYCNSMKDTFTGDSCIDLAQYGMVPSKDDSTTTPQTPVPTPSMNNTQTSICGDKLKEFCGMHEDIQLNVWLTVTASIIVVISLIHFLMALAANHTYMRIFRKGYRSVPKVTHAFPAFRYSDGELPIQEPLNVRDENTQF